MRYVLTQVEFLRDRKFRLSQPVFGPHRWRMVPVLPDHVLAAAGHALCGPARDASELTHNEAVDLYKVLCRSKRSLDNASTEMEAELLFRCPYYLYIPPLDVDVNDDSAVYDPATSVETARRYALALASACEAEGLGRPSWHSTNSRGGLHGDLLCPPEVKSPHLLRALYTVVVKAARRAGVPIMSDFKGGRDKRPAVYLDDSLYMRDGDSRGLQWRLVGALKDDGGTAKRPIELATLRVLPASAPTTPADQAVVAAAVDRVSPVEDEVARRTKKRPSGAPSPMHGDLTTDDMRILSDKRVARLWGDTRGQRNRSQFLFDVLFAAARAGADDACLSRLAWNMPGENKVLEDRRDQGYVDGTIRSVRRKLARVEAERKHGAPTEMPSLFAVVADWISGLADRAKDVARSVAFCGTVMSSSLGINAATTANMLGGTKEARETVTNALRRIESGTFEKEDLRSVVGSLQALDFSWAAANSTGVPFDRAWQQFTTNRLNTAAEIAPVVAKLMERAAHTEDREQKGRLHKVRHRIMSSPACGRREANSRCLACKQSRCKIHLYCGDASCNGCTKRRIRDVLELIVLPKRVRVVHAAGYETKAAAQRDYGRLARYGKRPLALYAPVPNGSWEITLMADERDHGACSVMGALPGATTHYCSEHSARDWIARVFAMKHATARVAIEDPTNERALDLVLEAYRTHVASSRDTSIAWPTKEQIRAHRRERALAAALENPDAEDPTSCPCPLDTPVSVEVTNLDTGVVVMTDLLTPPTLAQVVAHEAGERVKVNRRRRFGRFGNRSGLRAPLRC